MIQFIEEAQRLIAMSSVSQDGNEEIANYLHALLSRMGFKTNLQEVSHSAEGVSKKQYNVIGILGDNLVDTSTKKGLLLNTHIDTVSPGIRSHWTETNGNPFQMTIQQNKIYGLGTADVKLDFLCKLKACEKYKDRKLKMPIYLVGTAAEEIGMLGAKYLIKSKALNPKYVLVGEPSELAVMYAHKGYCVYNVSIQYLQYEKDAKGFNTRMEMRCFGKSSHGSYPHLGDNAIVKMFNTIQKIKDANFQFKISRIAGGDSVNKVPDLAAVEFYLPASSFDDFKRFYREKLSVNEYTGAQDGQIQIQHGGLGETGIKFFPNNLMEAIDQIRKNFASFSENIFKNKDTSFSPSESTMNLGKITFVDGRIDMFFDFRLLPEIDPAVFDEHIKTQIQNMNTNFPNLIMKVNRQRMNPSLNMDENSDLVRAAIEAQRAAGIDAGIGKKATSTEAAQYFAAGFDAIVFGPSKSAGNSHTPNEHALVDQLDKAVHFYDKMIERFCI